jgi:hypothetical protein
MAYNFKDFAQVGAAAAGARLDAIAGFMGAAVAVKDKGPCLRQGASQTARIAEAGQARALHAETRCPRGLLAQPTDDERDGEPGACSNLHKSCDM